MRGIYLNPRRKTGQLKEGNPIDQGPWNDSMLLNLIKTVRILLKLFDIVIIKIQKQLAIYIQLRA